MTSPTPHLHPQVDLELHVSQGMLELLFRSVSLGKIPLSFDALYALPDAVDPQLLSDGISLRISERDFLTPLGFESLLQTIMINMVHCVFPRMHKMSPLRKHLQLQSIDCELHAIRNAALINNFNHLFAFKGAFQHIPIVIAMPGPSLDLDFIKNNRDKMLLMSAGRAAQKLIQANIIPDFIYMQDINAAAWRLSFDQLGDKQISSILIANPLGAIYKYHNNFSRVIKAWNAYSFEQDQLPKIDEIAPSSATGAYSAARLLGCDPVMFIGNDCGSVEPLRSSNAQGLHRWTNLPMEQQNGTWSFFSHTINRDIYLRFGDELSISTSHDYISGVQWLKKAAKRDMLNSSLRTYDKSMTAFCQFNSVIKPFYKLIETPKIEIKLHHYKTKSESISYLYRKQTAYRNMLRLIKRGSLPQSIFTKPYSCLLEATNMAIKDSRIPSAKDMTIIIQNAVFLLEQIDISISESKCRNMT